MSTCLLYTSDADGNVYDKTAGDYPSQVIVYDSDTSKTKIRGTTDNDGSVSYTHLLYIFPEKGKKTCDIVKNLTKWQ